MKFTMTNSPLRVIFAGTPDFAATSLQALIEHQAILNIQIIAVYTQPDRKAGRGQKLHVSAVKEVALQYNLPIEQPQTFKLSDPSGLVSRETLKQYQPDLMIVAAYGLILPVGVLTTPNFGCLNIHASLLPRWRGAAPIQRAILAGDTTTGITIMQMAQGLDTGDILYKTACDITATDTAQSLHDKLAKLGAEAIITVLKDLPDYQANAKVQQELLANYAQKITTTEGEIDWQQSAKTINQHIRALNSYTFYQGERIKVLACEIIDPSYSTDKPAGTIIEIDKQAIYVASGPSYERGQQIIRLTLLQWAGGKPLTAQQIANGHKLQVGASFS